LVLAIDCLLVIASANNATTGLHLRQTSCDKLHLAFEMAFEL
jgi:hypothetical protein